VIINLQRTQHDNKAEKSGGLVIRAKADEVMRLLMSKLETPVPPYIREVSVNIKHHFEKKEGTNYLVLGIHSTHGPKYALPMIRSVSFHLQGSGETQPMVCAQPPFEVEKQVASLEECIVKISVELEEADGMDDVSMVYTGAREALLQLKNEHEGAVEMSIPVGGHKGEQMWTFVSQVVHYYPQEEKKEDDKDRGGKKARLE
jgi:hypothetical protein